MVTQNSPIRLVRALAQPRRAAGFVVTLALLSAACSDAGSGITSPALFSQGGNGPSAASSFAVLANQAVTCTDGNITGDVGTLSATGSFTQTNCVVDGTFHAGRAAIQAYRAFVAEYAALADVPCDVVLTGTLAGVTLAPGVYCFDAAAAPTGVLTLNGPSNGTWLFKIGTGGTGALTGTNFSVVMEGGADPCNVTWWVAQAATMTTSHFIGTILAGEAITLTGGTFDGNIWAGASGVGDVTITGTALVGCESSKRHGHGHDKDKCNQGVGNGPEGCDPGNSNHHNSSNDEDGGTPGDPGRQGR